MGRSRSLGEGVRLSEELGETWERGILFQLLAVAPAWLAANTTRRRLLPDDPSRSSVISTIVIGLAQTIALLASIEMARGSAIASRDPPRAVGGDLPVDPVVAHGAIPGCPSASGRRRSRMRWEKRRI